MKKIFSKDEKKIIIFLVAFLAFGLILLNAKKLVKSSSSEKGFQDSLKVVVKKSNEPALININEADIETLTELPRIGPARAKSIYDYREKKGKFSSLIELVNIKGIGKKTLAKLIPHLEIVGDSTEIRAFVAGTKSKTFSPNKNVNINTASKEN